MYLAIGFVHDFGFDWSIHVPEESSPMRVAQLLAQATIGSGCCGGDRSVWPTKIYMIKNTADGPVVFDRYFAGMHYPNTEKDHFVPWERNHVTPTRLGPHQQPN